MYYFDVTILHFCMHLGPEWLLNGYLESYIVQQNPGNRSCWMTHRPTTALMQGVKRSRI